MLTSQELKKIGIGISHLRNENYDRIDWDSYFMEVARTVAKRSHDANTQHGCVIVKNNNIVTTGFNGYPAGSPDKILPNLREGGFKYQFINHAEESAIHEAARRGASIQGAKIYITGHPCAGCCRKLVSVGILDWIIGDVGHYCSPEEDILKKFWIEKFKVKITHFSG